MDAERFVKELKVISPDRGMFSNMDLGNDYIDSVIAGFNPEKIHSDSTFSDPLLKLVTQYNANVIHVGMIEFSDEVRETDRYYIIGEFEVDWLTIDKLSGCVKIVEKHNYHEMWECAIDSSRFLEAMIEACKFLLKSSTDDNLYENKQAHDAVAEVCSSLAGGERFLDFYKMFFGCW
ncbi:hypothetical protein [Pedobacter sp. ASV28]|uniref:hypothetical protein n=1 Tax=Pedobacter sp. ASV28 TaxID=2795123 RepID=UPI0018ED0041|nr:hypothetical protein [Pedobacter sp. ASV28]